MSTETLIEKEYLTVKEYAEKKGVAHATVYINIKSGKIKAEKLPNSNKGKRIKWEDYKDYEFRDPIIKI